jgi:hypothetical protein
MHWLHTLNGMLTELIQIYILGVLYSFAVCATLLYTVIQKNGPSDSNIKNLLCLLPLVSSTTESSAAPNIVEALPLRRPYKISTKLQIHKLMYHSLGFWKEWSDPYLCLFSACKFWGIKYVTYNHKVLHHPQVCRKLIYEQVFWRHIALLRS